jgi:hypothetical protein
MAISNIESGLKKILSNSALLEEPQIGSYGWLYVAKSKYEHNGLPIYKLGHTGRLNTHLKKLKNDPNFSNDEPIVIKVWNGASYFIKVLRRMLKPNKAVPKVGGRDWFALNKSEIKWLKSIPICKSSKLESEVIELLGANRLSTLRKEGLMP